MSSKLGLLFSLTHNHLSVETRIHEIDRFQSTTPPKNAFFKWKHTKAKSTFQKHTTSRGSSPASVSTTRARFRCAVLWSARSQCSMKSCSKSNCSSHTSQHHSSRRPFCFRDFGFFLKGIYNFTHCEVIRSGTSNTKRDLTQTFYRQHSRWQRRYVSCKPGSSPQQSSSTSTM